MIERITHELLDSKNINICQFQCNPHLETTMRARLDPKHVDKRARIVQETASKNSQAVRYRWHVHMWGWVRPGTGKSFGWVSRGKVCTVAIILLDLLHQMIYFDRYVEN